MFEPLSIVAYVFATIDPDLFTHTVLDIVDPVTLIAAAVCMNVNTEAVHSVAKEFTDVYVAADVPEGSLASHLVQHPVTFIDCTALPLCDAKAMPPPLTVLKLHLTFVLLPVSYLHALLVDQVIIIQHLGLHLSVCLVVSVRCGVLRAYRNL